VALVEQSPEATMKQNRSDAEQEFVRHICNILESSLANTVDLHIDLGMGELIQPRLREFFWMRAVEAMEWILLCGKGDMAFDQTKDDEIPVLCKYYNLFIGKDAWSKDDHTVMRVLNKYDRFKTGRYGNFGRLTA
jgi:hypothetical protein